MTMARTSSFICSETITRAFPSSSGEGSNAGESKEGSLLSEGSSGSTGGAGLTVSSVGACSDTPNDRLNTRSTREKNLDDSMNHV